MMKSVIDVCGDVSSNYLTNQSKEESRRTQKKHKQAAKKLKHVKEKNKDCRLYFSRCHFGITVWFTVKLNFVWLRKCFDIFYHYLSGVQNFLGLEESIVNAPRQI
jgi:hypothetical protein